MGENDEGASRDEYAKRINRVLEYVVLHLDGDLSLAALAEVACFSPWHFHRIFTALMDETPDDYVRRIRLEKAASRLYSSPSLPITEVARLCGFSTSALFSRNFAKRYGVSPSKYRLARRAPRDRSKNRQIDDKNGYPLDKDAHEPSKGGKDPFLRGGYDLFCDGKESGMGDAPAVTARRIEPIRTAYMWHSHGYHQGVDATVDRMIKWARARELMRPDTKLLGVWLDNPEITPSDKCRLLVCVSLPDEVDQRQLALLTGRSFVGSWVIPGGLYAVWTQERTKITEGFYRFYRYWLPDSGYVPTDAEGFMLYREPLDTAADRNYTVDIYIPIAPL
jgi:AraC family transcriptional regulator